MNNNDDNWTNLRRNGKSLHKLTSQLDEAIKLLTCVRDIWVLISAEISTILIEVSHGVPQYAR
jgi:hypothetical protein